MLCSFRDLLFPHQELNLGSDRESSEKDHFLNALMSGPASPPGYWLLCVEFTHERSCLWVLYLGLGQVFDWKQKERVLAS